MGIWVDTADAPALFSGFQITPKIFNDVRDGRPPPRPTFGFRVTKSATNPKSKVRFDVGMQGQMLRCDGQYAYVECRDLFDAAGQPLKEWIHRDFIIIGTKPYGTWSIDKCYIPRTPAKMTAQEHKIFEDPTCKHLAHGISTFLSALAKANPEGLTEESLARLGGKSGSKVAWITARIVAGVDDAGLLSVLNNPNFTSVQLFNSAKVNCQTSSEASGKSGIYFRGYSTNVSGKKPKFDLYFGQSVDLYARFLAWKKGGHEDLINKADNVAMRCICLTDKVFYDDHKYIMEQVFVSLFQTYKKSLVDKANSSNLSNDNDVESFHGKNCLDMTNIASAAAKVSGWTGAVRRDSFWSDTYSSCDGLNYQSPIAEAPKHEPMIWIRTDGWMPDKDDPKKSIPIANFAREAPKRLTVMPASAKAASKGDFAIFFHLQSESKDYQMRISRTLPAAALKDGLEWPASGTEFSVTFEVRTDWKPHPYSWARLPLIGPFEDWDRANCWALCIHWTDLKGNARSRYLHCERPTTLIDDNSAGSLQGYKRGIEVIHYLLNERIPTEAKHSWLETPPMASVKVIKHDYVEQKIKLVASKGVTTTTPISGKRKNPRDILREMSGHGVHGNLQLENVGRDLQGTKSANSSIKWGNRRKCDTCMLLPRNTGKTLGCDAVPGANPPVCKNCAQLYGRPGCTFSYGMPAQFVPGQKALGNSFEELDNQNDTVNAIRRTALIGSRGWSGSGDELVNADPVIFKVDQGDDIEEADEAQLDAAVKAAPEPETDWQGPKK